jgi:hypothetical protein
MWGDCEVNNVYKLICTAGIVSMAISARPAAAFEFGTPGAVQKPGVTIGGASAGAPPPGIYMFDQFAAYQAKIVGPGAPPGGTVAHYGAAATGFLWVPGWTFLGATYNAVLVTPFVMDSIGSPVNVQQDGMHNTYIVPVELSWKLQDTGFFVKTGLGIYVPDGNISGPAGLSGEGTPWYTFQPEFIVSYLKDGWNLTANIFAEFNTKNTVTGYRSGDILHAEFRATKTIDKWTFGPVAYYFGQVSGDTSSAFYGNAINTNRYDEWAVGGLVGYNFGPVDLTVWATKEFTPNPTGGTAIPGRDSAVGLEGYSAFLQLSYRLWAPDAPPSSPKLSGLIHK